MNSTGPLKFCVEESPGVSKTHMGLIFEPAVKTVSTA